MALGITPLAVADIPNYRRWVVEPPLPDSVLDVGLRNEPNRELIQRLNPSLLLLSEGFGPSVGSLRTLAPSWISRFSDGQHAPLTLLHRDVLALGDQLGRAPQAQQHLEAMEAQFVTLGRTVTGFRQRPLLLFSFLDSRRMMVFGRNSLLADVLARMGLQSGWQGATNYWGSMIVGIETLAQVRDVHAIGLLQEDAASTQQVLNSDLWRSIPFVREGRLHFMPAVWFFGGGFSAQRFARLLSATLEQA